MKVITLSNQKGGVAKTSTVAALASGLVGRGYKVIAVDLDPQCNLSMSAGADIIAASDALYKVFRGASSLADHVNLTTAGYSLVTGGLALSAADMDFTQTGREYMLQECLDSISNDYDYCIIDTPPTLGILMVNALTAANDVIVPLTADAYAVQGLSQLNMLIQRVKRYSNNSLVISGLLITRYDARTNVSKVILEQITDAANKLGTKVYNAKIRNSVAVRECQLIHSDLLTDAPKANASIDYQSFISEYLEGSN